MARKVTEPEHFVYIVLVQENNENDYTYHADFPKFQEAKEVAKKIPRPTKVIRGRKATVRRFLKNLESK
ncbi:hypothetical protein AKJ38_01275 [candidate division MSBL1 archaeon SCGC-AAA259I14]|uniref:Uncharacterized protein n=1 Tax=candidate division MSBL1 archaeon SCGC-AAA259I14 TaxID=1698268 RepID=A0A133UT32_9EURY|nr:hypothetical protein AKJ38_01275 [candidate division MSBL1 archaeon SCGC-AAA259I14]